MWGVITTSGEHVGEERARPLVLLKQTQAQPRTTMRVRVLQSSRGNKTFARWRWRVAAAPSRSSFFVTLSEKPTYKGSVFLRTFVSARIQSVCASCVSAPTISTRSGCRYSSTVNTALPGTQLAVRYLGWKTTWKIQQETCIFLHRIKTHIYCLYFKTTRVVKVLPNWKLECKNKSLWHWIKHNILKLFLLNFIFWG